MIWGTTILRNLHICIYIYVLLFLYTSFGKPATHYSEEKNAKARSVYLKVKKTNRCEIVLFFKPYSRHMFGDNFLTPPLGFLTDGKCVQNPPVWIHNWHFPSFSAAGSLSRRFVEMGAQWRVGNWCLCLWGKAEQWVATHKKSNSYVLHCIKNMFIGI